ncbi:MAG TPA: MBL fold metallo-hydrolase, partial [Gemmatimonadaceae bacterium]|nr:MBL fold metallo-hydrolase [Gemmatimonadaceae bacterium]
MVLIQRAGEGREEGAGSRASSARARITNIGHATLLIEIGGVRVLTDPNFDPRLAGILGRVAPPGIALEQLPPLNAILLSHAHADHLSRRSLNKLPPNIPIFAPPAVARRLNGVGVAPGETVSVNGLSIQAAKAKHRVVGGANMYRLDASDASIFFAGDTGLTSKTHEMGPVDIALLPIGKAPWWRPGFRRNHLSSDDALVLFERLGARYLIP